MALSKRIIACLDVKDGKTVKGTRFENLRDMGSPVELASFYATQGIDELVFLDISATNEKRKTLASLVAEVARVINIPFTVGGGINCVEDVKILLENGADKVSVNSAAVKNPKLVYDLAKQFGSQCVVVAIDTKFDNGDWLVFINGGKQPTKLKTKDWVKQVEELGAGEILLTSIDHDGTRQGFACELTACISSLIALPVIASGGAGRAEDFADIFEKGKADAALAAGIFHERIVDIPSVKNYLQQQQIPVRL
ncbi:MAG: imidazole glycerol phosphate synthase subunit HisF [Chitinophagaceae bacterium]